MLLSFFFVVTIVTCNLITLGYLQVEATIENICRSEGAGAILVFLTGWDEISKILEKLKVNNLLRNSSKFLLLPLHGSMPTVNQREIFDRPPANVRQVSERIITFILIGFFQNEFYSVVTWLFA